MNKIKKVLLSLCLSLTLISSTFLYTPQIISADTSVIQYASRNAVITIMAFLSKLGLSFKNTGYSGEELIDKVQEWYNDFLTSQDQTTLNAVKIVFRDGRFELDQATMTFILTFKQYLLNRFNISSSYVGDTSVSATSYPTMTFNGRTFPLSNINTWQTDGIPIITMQGDLNYYECVGKAWTNASYSSTYQRYMFYGISIDTSNGKVYLGAYSNNDINAGWGNVNYRYNSIYGNIGDLVKVYLCTNFNDNGYPYGNVDIYGIVGTRSGKVTQGTNVYLPQMTISGLQGYGATISSYDASLDITTDGTNPTIATDDVGTISGNYDVTITNIGDLVNAITDGLANNTLGGSILLGIGTTITESIDNGIGTIQQGQQVQSGILSRILDYLNNLLGINSTTLTNTLNTTIANVTSHTGILTYPISLTIDFLNRILTYNPSDWVLTFPSLPIINNESKSLNVSQMVRENTALNNFYGIYVAIFDGICAFWLIRLLDKKWNEVFNK